MIQKPSQIIGTEFLIRRKKMKAKMKKVVYKVTGTVLVWIARSLGFVCSQLEKADTAVSSVGMEMLDVANGVQ